MVATLVRLKLRLLVNTFKREVWRVVLLVLGALYGLGLLAGLLFAVQELSHAAIDTRQLVAVLVGSLLVLGWAVVPLVAFGVDDTLDPQRFSLFAVPSARLALGLVVAGAIGIPGVLTTLASQVPVLLWGQGDHAAPAVATAVAGGLLATATCLLAARVTTTAAATRLRSRRGRDVIAVLGLLLLLPVMFLPGLMGTVDPRTFVAQLSELAVVLAWTPLGSPWAAPADVAAGAPLLAVARIGVSTVTVVVLAVVWRRLLAVSMVAVASSGPRRHGRASARTATLPLGRTATLARSLGVPPAAAAVAGRSLRYWRSDPRYLSNVIGTALAPLVLVVVLTGATGGPERSWAPLLVAPMFGAFAGWSIHNDTAMDSTAYWMHLSAPVPGVQDRAGRLLAAAVWMLPSVVGLAVLGCAWSQRWEMFPAVLGASLGTLGAGLAVSAVASGLLVYPTQPPGSSPFSATSGPGNIVVTLLAQAVSSGVTLALSVPVAVSAVLAATVASWWGWVALAVGLLGGAALAGSGVVLGGRALDRRGAGMLATMRGWPKH